MFTKISAFHFLGQDGQHRRWRGRDETGQQYTAIATALGAEVTRVIVRRGAGLDLQRYQLASGAQGTLPYHSWMVDKGDEAWPTSEISYPFVEDVLQGFAASKDGLRLQRLLSPEEHIFGLGERTGSMDKRGQAFPVWNVDPPMNHDDQTSTMYTSIPFYLALKHTTGQTYGILIDHTGNVDVDLGKTQTDLIQLSVSDDLLVAYFFAGPTPADITRQYTELTGRMPLPPLWALGHHQSRWGYESVEEVAEIARTMRERQHPCDSLWLDIDYMDGFRNFTWNPETFPEPRALVEELRKQGLRTVTIIDPGTAYDEAYSVYQEGHARDYFCRNPDGSYFFGSVWPGTCVFPDFSRDEVRKWWGNLYAEHLELGVAGIWNDMDEPALTSILSDNSAEHVHGRTMDSIVQHQAGGENRTGLDGAPVEHRLFHNAYGLEMARSTYEGMRSLKPDQRPFVLTRSGTGGVQRYAAVWTGDNTSRWEHISLMMTMMLNLSMSGVPFVGMDIGGFWDDSNGELLVRFAQLGALIPFTRNHYAKFIVHQEPWSFGEPYESAYRNAMELRYRSLPYLYTIFAEAARTGSPIIRPLYYHYAQDRQAITIEDELLIGANLLSAPLYEAGSSSRNVYLPQGTWFDYWAGTSYQGEQCYSIEAPIERWPLFVRSNSILPQGPLMQYTDEIATDPLTLHCYMTTNGQADFTLYEDDGQSYAYASGAYAETAIMCKASESGATVVIDEYFSAYRPQRDWYEILVHLNGKTLTQRVKAGQGRASVTL